MAVELQPGNYTGELQEVGVDKSKNGIPLVYSEWNIDGYLRTIRWYLGCNKKDTDTGDAYDKRLKHTIKVSKSKLKAVGFNEDWTNPAFSVKEFELYCKHEEYNGDQQERWDISTRREAQVPDADVMMDMISLYDSIEVDTPAPAAGGLTQRELKDEAYQKAWGVFIARNDNMSGAELRNTFDSLVRDTVDKPAAECTVADWERVEAGAAF